MPNANNRCTRHREPPRIPPPRIFSTKEKGYEQICPYPSGMAQLSFVYVVPTGINRGDVRPVTIARNI
jgi:hypothetical protein